MRPPFWAEALLRLQLDPREEEVVVGDFREEFLDVAVRLGRVRATLRYCRQVGSFLREGGAVRMLGVPNFRSLGLAGSVWFALFAIVAIHALRAQSFTPVPAVVAFLAIVPLAALDAARRSGYVRTGLIFGGTLGLVMFLSGAVAVKFLNQPSPPLRVLPLLPAITVLAAATIGAIAGRRFRRLGQGLSSPSLLRYD